MDKNAKFLERVRKTEARLHWALAVVYIGLFGAIVSIMPVRKEKGILIFVCIGFFVLATLGWGIIYAIWVKLKEYLVELEES